MWLAGILTMALCGQVLEPAGPWQVVDTRDGVTLKARPIKGSAYEELQASAELPADPATMLTLILIGGIGPLWAPGPA